MHEARKPSVRLAPLVGCIVGISLLSGCLGTTGSPSFAPNSSAAAAKTSAAVPHTRSAPLSRDITLKAPKGYCIDTGSVRSGLNGSSAMIATCTALSGKPAGASAALMTVSLSPPRPSDAPAVTHHDLRRAADGTVLQSTQNGTLALARIKAKSPAISGADTTYWRGATTLNSRLVLMSLYPAEQSALNGDAGAATLTSLAKGLSAKNEGLLGQLRKTAPVDRAEGELQNNASTVLESRSQAETASEPKKPRSSIIGRIFNRS